MPVSKQGTFFAATIIALMALFVVPQTTFAATGLTIQPIKVSETLKPGESATGSILLTNASDGPIDVEVSKQDFIPVSNADSIQFVGRSPGVTSVIDWISVGSSNTFSFKQGEAREIPYTITAPANAEPGSHLGVILFKATPKSDGGGSIKVGTQVGMLVLVAVPGDHLEKGTITGFSTNEFIQNGPVSFTLGFKNEGTIHFEPKGQILVKNMFGAQVASIPIEGQVVLPTGEKNLSYAWNVVGLLLGRYSAEAIVKDNNGEVLATATTSFWAVPVWYILGFIGVLLVLYFVIAFLKSRVKITFK